MNIIFLLIPTLFFNVNSSCADFLEDASLPFTQVDTTFHVEKYPILSPLEKGPLKVLFIGQRDVVGRLSVEAAARLDCLYETVLTDTRRSFGAKGLLKGFDIEVLSDDYITGRIERLLGYNWDVIWLDFDISSLPEELRSALLDQISSGAGLVYTGEMKELDSFITNEKVDERQLKVVSYDSFKQFDAGKRNKGTIVVIPPVNPDVSILETGDYYNTAVNSIFFASARRTGTIITEIQLPRKTIKHEITSIMNFKVHLFREEKPDTMKVHVRYRNEKDELANESISTYIIDRERSFIILNYPQLPIGKYSLDISISDSDGVKAFAGTSFYVETSDKISDVRLWNLSAKAGEFIIGTVETSSPIKEGILITVSFNDCWGRNLGTYDLDTVPGRKSVDFTFKIKNPLSHLMIIQVVFYRNNELVQIVEKPVFIERLYDPHTFSLVVYDDCESEFLILKKYETLFNEGVTVVARDVSSSYDPGKAFNMAVNILLSGAEIIPVLTNAGDSFDNVIVERGNSSLDFITELEQHLKSMVDTLHHVNPLAYSIWHDNIPLQYETATSFSARDFESFHIFLEKKYGSVEDLNKVWETQYSSFSETKPVTLDEARQTDSFAVWKDTMLYKSGIFKQIYKCAYNAVSKHDSTALIGISGFHTSLNTYSESDFFDSTGSLDLVLSYQNLMSGLYGDRVLSGVLASFSQPSALTGLMVSGDVYSRINEDLLRYIPWQSLFGGMNSIWWNKMSGGVNAALTPEFSISPAFSIVAEESRAIMNGIDRLLLGSTRHTDGIGIFYSPESIIAAYTSSQQKSKVSSLPGNISSVTTGETFEKNLPGFDMTDNIEVIHELPVPMQNYSSYRVLKSAGSFYLACQDLGYTPTFISADQIKNNALIDKRFSILFLPYSQAISDEVIKYIKEFTRRGGTIIADMRPAVMDENLSMRDKGTLDEIFGISQSTERIAPEITGTFMIEDFSLEKNKNSIPPVRHTRTMEDGSELMIKNCRGDSSVTVLDGATVVASIDSSPALIINEFGEGKGIFLNMGIELYEKLRFRDDGEVFLHILSLCMDKSGMKLPRVAINDSNENRAIGVNSYLFKDGTGEYIGLLTEPAGEKEVESNINKMIMKINNPKKLFYVYNIHTNKFLGAIDKIPLEMLSGRSDLYALLPYRVKNIDLNVKSSVVSAGDSVQYSVEIIPHETSSKPGRHVIRIQVIGPDGNEMPYFSESFETEDGIYKGSIHILNSDSPGQWLIKVQDVATGKRAEKKFFVMKI